MFSVPSDDTARIRNQRPDWHDILTLDKSWFHYITDHELRWLPPDGKVPNRERITIESEKAMLPIVWGPTGFAAVTALESGCKFNAGYNVSKVLISLFEWWCEYGVGNFRKQVLHGDNARPHKAAISQQFMGQNAVVGAAHPTYSPDLAPSDFCLFGHVKGLPRGESFETGEQLGLAVEGIFGFLAKGF
jgi:histone-lysine N-methyltransferase SETMAR